VECSHPITLRCPCQSSSGLWRRCTQDRWTCVSAAARARWTRRWLASSAAARDRPPTRTTAAGSRPSCATRQSVQTYPSRGYSGHERRRGTRGSQVWDLLPVLRGLFRGGRSRALAGFIVGRVVCSEAGSIGVPGDRVPGEWRQPHTERRARCVPDRTANQGDPRSLTDRPGTPHDQHLRRSARPHPEPSKLVMRVRFPSSALFISAQGLDSTLLKRSLGSVPAARSQRLFGFALTLTISTSPSVPWKSAGLAVYSGSRLLAAVAAICRSEERLRGCRPAARTAAQIWP